MKNTDIFPKLPDLLNNAANSLRQARIEKIENLRTQLTMNFIRIKQFIEMMSIDSMTVSGVGASKFSFIIDNVHRNLKFIPSNYKQKVADKNSCSIFYDLENLYEFNKKTPFPKELDADLSKEITALLGDLVRLFTTEKANGTLELKLLQGLRGEVIRFDRDSKHFQYFSYFNDQNHLNEAIELIEFAEQISITDVSGKYQWMSGISQAIEHLSKRMLSPRLIDYLSSDINSDELSSIRNFIVHREQDKSNRLEDILFSEDAVFLSMKQEIAVIKLSLVDALSHLKSATKPREMQGDIFQRVIILMDNHEDVTIDSIRKFYEKTDAGYKYTKIPHSILMNCRSITDFESAYPELSSKITTQNKEVIINAALLGNRKLFVKIINQIDVGLKKYFIEQRQKGYDLIKVETNLLKKDSRIEITELEKFNFADDNIRLTGLKETIFTTKKLQVYKNKLKKVMNELKSSTDEIDLLDLYNLGIDFDSYRVMDAPLYKLSNFVSESYSQVSIKARDICHQRYAKDTEFYKIKLVYGQEALQAHDIGLGITQNGAIVYQTWGGQDYLRQGNIGIGLYRKLLEMIVTNNARIDFNTNLMPHITLTTEEETTIKKFVIAEKDLQFILIPLTHQEHADVYLENLQSHEVSFKRNRLLDGAAITRLKVVFSKADMQDRMKNYLAFLEISEKFLKQRDLLLEVELYLMSIAGLIKESKDAKRSLPDADILKDFRNYLAHDRELGETAISHSHEQISLKIILEFTRKVEKIIIPALHSIVVEGNVIESQSNDIIILNLHDIKYDKDNVVGEEDQNMLLVKLLQDPDIYDQIVDFIHQEGLTKVKEFFFGKERTSNIKDDIASQDQQILNDIEQIETIIGKEALSHITYFYQFISKALKSHSSNNAYHKILGVMGGIVEKIQHLLDVSAIYKDLDVNDQVISIFEQLQEFIIFVGDSPESIAYSRPPYFSPDDDYNPGENDGGQEPKNGDSPQLDDIFDIFYNTTNTSFGDTIL